MHRALRLGLCHRRAYNRPVLYRPINRRAMSDATTSQPPGDDAGIIEKSKAALKREAKRAEKNAKFVAKSAAKAATEPKDKKDKAAPPKTKVEEPEFVNKTPPGEKKGDYL
jgi:valyl-tRNA synthetase